ncbi:MAG TPA: hypothetical protein VIL46_07470 [Gemmataceae bacterium]
MNFSVHWPAAVLADLAAIWLAARDRNAVTAAQSAIERALGADPVGNGRLLSEGLWRMDHPPLAVS